MNKTLVLTEKPSVGKDIARVLGCINREDGYFESNQYVVTWALGHLVTLADPESYDEKYKSWRLEDLPIMPENLDLEVIPKTRKQYQTVKTLMYRKDIEEIVIATDSGREGELVARWIIDKANVNKKLKRLWISSVTDKAIKEGFQNLKDGKYYYNLYQSAASRAMADWYVGINATRALTCKYNAQLSCGRVQTPTLAIIYSRELEIKNFQSESYYGIKVNCKGATFHWFNKKTNDNKTFDEVYCDNVLSNIQNKELKIEEINNSEKRTYSPGLYDLTELQRDANRLFGFSAKDTLSIMQTLYEHHKILTYPRTDSRFLSTDIVDTIKERLQSLRNTQYYNKVLPLLNKPIKGNNHFVDNSKVSDHHAIIPTEETVNLSKLTDVEKKIFDLVVKRFLAVLYPPYIYEQLTVKGIINNEIFTAKGKKVISYGWKEVYNNDYQDEDDDIRQNLPDFVVNERIRVTKPEKTTDQTKPPVPFTEGTLLSAMENPIKYMESADKDLKKTIGETGGLGTVATRADIIEKLFNIFAIEKKGNYLYTTAKGRQLLDLVPEELKSPVLTAKWEQSLTKIANGALNKNDFITDMKDYAQRIINQIKNSGKKYKHDNLSSVKCPNCGKYLLEVNSQDSKLLICQDRACGYRKVLSKVTNSRCPNCHKKLELVGEGENQTFICSCGHREKLSTFNERKKQEKNNLSKRDVSKYLNDINKESNVSVNSSLADALKKLKLK